MCLGSFRQSPAEDVGCTELQRLAELLPAAHQTCRVVPAKMGVNVHFGCIPACAGPRVCMSPLSDAVSSVRACMSAALCDTNGHSVHK